ncbi:hypothetical protein LEP1GSC192_3945 [Leptospira sp. B5-022]|nr:hypothetical protein LEP1GSC192_3945 [Leptospira sp. B5-022]
MGGDFSGFGRRIHKRQKQKTSLKGLKSETHFLILSFTIIHC